MSKLTLELRLYLKATALKVNLIQMNHEGMSDFTSGVGEKTERGGHQKSYKYSPHTILTINSTQIEKKRGKGKR